MIPPDMAKLDPHLYRELRPDEQLLWWCRSDPQRRATSMSFRSQAINYGILACIMLFGIIMAIGFSSTIGVYMVFFFMLLIFSLLMLFLFLAIPRIITRALSRTVYGITNQRVIVITQGKKGPVVRSHTSIDFGPLERIDSSEGWGDISYGRPRFSHINGVQVKVIDQLNGIPNVRIVEDLLLRVFKNVQPTAPAYWNQQQQLPQQEASFAQPE